MTEQEVHAIVLKHLHALVPGTAERAIDPNAPLGEIGADSLDLVDVASRSMQELGVKIQRSEIGRIKTLSDLVRVLHQTWEASNVTSVATVPSEAPSGEQAAG